MARVVGRRSVERRGGETARGRGSRAGRPGTTRLDVPELPGRQRGPVRAVLELRGERSRGPGRLRADWSRAETSGLRSGVEPRSGEVRARGRPRRAAPSPCVPRLLSGPYGGAWTRSPAHKRAVVRPSPPSRPAGARSYAVPRRTRRRREAAKLAAWDRWRAGTACACCAR